MKWDGADMVFPKMKIAQESQEISVQKMPPPKT